MTGEARRGAAGSEAAAAGADLATAADAIEELGETAKLFLRLRGLATRPLTEDQAERLRAKAKEAR